MITDEGLTELAELFSADITQGQWGTGTATPSASDTGLESATATTLSSISASSSGNSVQFTHTVPSTDANGADLTEFELRFASGDTFNRTLGGAITKTNSFDLITLTTVSFIRG